MNENCIIADQEYEKGDHHIISIPHYGYNQLDYSFEMMGRCLPSGKSFESELPDISWILQQKDYYHSLSEIDQNILYFYVGNGFMYINDFLRTGKTDDASLRLDLMDVNLQIKETTRDTILNIYSQLHKIINNSPRVTKTFYVYRGQSTSLIEKIYSGYNPQKVRIHQIYQVKGVYSTSIFATNALKFSDDSMMYILRIEVPANVNCLYYERKDSYNEGEIMFTHGSLFELIELPTLYKYEFRNIERTTLKYVGQGEISLK